jgi:hypothetical protein
MSVFSALAHRFSKCGPFEPGGFPVSLRWRGIVLVPIACLVIGTGSISAQSRFPRGAKEETDPQSDRQKENNTRRLIMRDEELLRELKTSAAELDRLAKMFAKRWDAAPASVRPFFGVEDREQLKQMEKFAKKIRSSQGGYGGDDDAPLPTAFLEQTKLIEKLADEVRQQADKANRHTVSVGILSRASRILRLIKSIRGISNN